MPTDPCQVFVDNVQAIQHELTLPPPLNSLGKPIVSYETLLRTQLAEAEAALATCRQNHPRTVTVTGTPAAALSAFDDAIKTFMIDNGVTAGQLTIIKHGQTKLAHAYTGDWSGYPTTQPPTLFRLASCSKAFTCAAIQNLFDAGTLKPSDTVFPLLNITEKALASQNPDPNINKITVENLLNHAGGWNDHVPYKIPPNTNIPNYPPGTIVPASGFDPVFQTRAIALNLGLTGPPAKRDVARYMYGEPLQFPPGALNYTTSGTNSYSNFGYVLLGLVVEMISQMPYIDYVRKQVLEPIGIYDVFVSKMLAGSLYPREVIYDDPGSGLNGLEPHATIIAPYVVGGAGLVTELCDSAGGLMTTATALAQFIGQYPAWGVGHGRAPGSSRTGSESGVSSLAASRNDGVDFTYIFNTRSFTNGNALKTLGDALDHLFNTVSI